MWKPTCAVAALFCGLSFQPWMAPAAAQSAPGTRDTQRITVIGCLRVEPSRAGEGRGQSGERRFLITDSRAKSDSYRLDGNAEQLAYHVGHLVEIAGQLTGPIAPASPNSTESTLRATVKVKSVVYISPTCAK